MSLINLKCSVPKPSTVSDCEIVLKRLSAQIEPFQSKVNDLTSQMSSHQTEILRLQMLMDSANSEIKKLQKEHQQNMFDKKCVEKWHDELKKNGVSNQYLLDCKKFIRNHISQSNSNRVLLNHQLAEKYPASNYFIPLDAFKFLNISVQLPQITSKPDFNIPPNFREERKTMSPADKKADRKKYSQMWRNAYTNHIAETIFSVLTSSEIIKLAHYIKACVLLDEPHDSECDLSYYSTYATIFRNCRVFYDYSVVSQILDCNGETYDEGHGRSCCHKRYAYVLVKFEDITLNSSYVITYNRL